MEGEGSSVQSHSWLMVQHHNIKHTSFAFTFSFEIDWFPSPLFSYSAAAAAAATAILTH